MPQIIFPPSQAQFHQGARDFGKSVGTAVGRLAFDTQEEKEERARLEQAEARTKQIQQRTALEGRQAQDQTSARRAALQAQFPAAQAAARQDPELGQALASILTTAQQLPPAQQLRYLEEVSPAFFALATQKERSKLADELERGLALGEFSSPTFDALGIQGEDGKPAESPIARDVKSTIESLRSGQADPQAAREAVQELRRTQAEERLAIRRRVSTLESGKEKRTKLVKEGGLAESHPTVMAMDTLIEGLESGLVDPEDYTDRMISITTGRRVMKPGEKTESERRENAVREVLRTEPGRYAAASDPEEFEKMVETVLRATAPRAQGVAPQSAPSVDAGPAPEEKPRNNKGKIRQLVGVADRLSAKGDLSLDSLWKEMEKLGVEVSDLSEDEVAKLRALIQRQEALSAEELEKRAKPEKKSAPKSPSDPLLRAVRKNSVFGASAGQGG